MADLMCLFTYCEICEDIVSVMHYVIFDTCNALFDLCISSRVIVEW